MTIGADVRFEIEPEHDELLSVLERFVERQLRPFEVGAAWITDDQVPPDVARVVRRRSADLGLYAPDYPVRVGGQGLSQVGMALLRERAYSLDSRLASLVTSGPEGPTGVLLTATHAQQERYLRPLVEARAVRCLALTEPDAGSDASSIRTRAERVPGGWELTGSKHFISNAAIADFAIVFARTPGGPRCGEGISGFIVERGSPGFVIGRPIEGMSADVVQHEVMFDRCFVPDANLLGGEANLGWGYHALLQYFALGRLALASAANGMALRAFRIARDYATTRRAFGSTISRFQYIQGHLVESRSRGIVVCVSRRGHRRGVVPDVVSRVPGCGPGSGAAPGGVPGGSRPGGAGPSPPPPWLCAARRARRSRTRGAAPAR
jgi:alkylation response protein AidB-like acyl-CoA dehydrogenase